MSGEKLSVRGARHHNLKNVDLDIPKNRLVVISGMSGSGKSTLAFDTIYAEGQRRYVESLSAYARQFLDMMDKPDVDSIEGLSPAISIQQKTTSKNPRSTVGTTTEIYDYLRLLFARVGIPHCTSCGKGISTQSVDTICDSVLKDFEGAGVSVMAPVVQHKKGTHEKLFEQIRRDGYSRIRLDGKTVVLEDGVPALNKQKWHDIDIVVDRVTVQKAERSRLFEAIQSAIKASRGDVVISSEKGGDDRVFSQNNACPHCGISIGDLEPRTFSFNSPFGMCKTCNGLGVMLEFDEDLVIPDRYKSIMDEAIVPFDRSFSFEWDLLYGLSQMLGFDFRTPIKRLSKPHLDIILYGSDKEFEFVWDSPQDDMPMEHTGTFDGVLKFLKRRFLQTESEKKREWLKQFMRDTPCEACEGKKLRPEALAVRVGGKSIMEICNLSIEACYAFFSTLKLGETEQYIAKGILKEIRERLEFLKNVGLDYVTLDRTSSTLSGGESQRIRLATQIGSNLTGVLYVLDEPTIGLHQRDNARLIKTLNKLKNLGNTVIVVEHDEEVIRSSDWIVDLGPGAGVHGGNIVFEGTVKEITGDGSSITGRYLGDRSLITLKDKVRKRRGTLTVKGASANNLKDIDVEIPLGLLIAVTGVSGSGKSTLVNDILYRSLSRDFYRSHAAPGKHREILGVNSIDKVIAIDQSPISKNPRSNPATYTGVFTPIRELYAATNLSRERGYEMGQFSFNVKIGRCFACDGDGVKRIEMQFLSDVFVKCDECGGKRYNSETLAVTYRGKNIAEVLDMTVYEALQFFENIPAIKQKLQTLHDVGLEYIKLGQSSVTLSGGEAQRVKLSAELSKNWTGRTLYILDEPTTGLHFADVKKLLEVLNRLANLGNTVLVIEHNMDVIKNADWVIDLGPEGGEEGGRVMACGTPKQVSAAPGSYTGRYLKKLLK